MSQQPSGRRLSRRSMLAGIGTGGVAASHFAARALADGAAAPGGRIAPDAPLTRYPTVNALQSAPAIAEGELAETLGFHRPGDGGGALYQIHTLGAERQPNGGDVIALPGGLSAVLLENEAVNYRMFGAVGDGAFQRVELAQRGDQFLALRRGLGQRHRGLTQHEGRHEKSGHAAMRGAQPGRSHHRAIPV